MNLQEKLKQLEACNEARTWAGDRTLEVAWVECERGDWLLWLAGKLADRRLVVKAACAVARTSLRYLPAGEDRPLQAIETAEAWTEGKATIEEVRKAAYVAFYAASNAAYAAYAASAASNAAFSASNAASNAAAYAAAYDAAARATSLRESADIVRGIIKVEDLKL